MVAEARQCPDENVLVGYLEDGAACAAAEAIRAHIDVCAACDELVAMLVQGGVRAPAIEFAPGSHVGRFVLAERLGAGAMGVVYAARDPQLDRRIAIKVLRRASRARTARLLREAQVMARLAHPNVAIVHEVGMIGDEIFIAM